MTAVTIPSKGMQEIERKKAELKAMEKIVKTFEALRPDKQREVLDMLDKAIVSQ